MSIRVLTDHEVPAHPPMRVVADDAVEVGERDDDWPEFVFVSRGHEKGWMPERHLDAGRPRATVVEAYDTTELPVRRGDHVEMLVGDDPSGWGWCRGAGGGEGWVPYRVLDLPRP